MAKFLKLKRDNSQDVVYVNPEFIVSMEVQPSYTVLTMSDGQYKVITVAETPRSDTQPHRRDQTSVKPWPPCY